MFIEAVVVSSFISFSLAGPIDGRIVNGTDASPGEFPFMVSLREFDSHVCGASILDENFILTAAHCVKGFTPSYITIQFGTTDITSNQNIVNVSKIILHPNYNHDDARINDVAIIKLSSPLTFSSFVSPTILPPALNATPENELATVIGWGYQYSYGVIMTNLQKVNISVYSDEDCERIHKETGPTSREYHICAGVPEGGKGQCSGDSGGPLIVSGYQVGIVSWSVKPCAVKGYPGVFTKVSKHVPWILEQIVNN